MIVDDDEMVRKAIRIHLENEGYSTIEATNGDDALTLYRHDLPDVVLMDVLMPKMNGYQACKQLRILVGDYPLPILMLTTLQDEDATQEAFEVKATDFITKPINWPLLVHRVHHALEARNFELELRKKRSQLIKTQEVAGMGHFEYDPTTNQVLCSNTLFSLLGFNDNERSISLDAFLSLSHPADRKLLAQFITDASHYGKAYALEHRMLGTDGQEYIVQHQGMVTQQSGEKKYHLLGTLIDITTAKQKDSLLEEQLQNDALTGLPNRKQLDSLLSKALKKADNNETLLGIFFIGLDRFKNINSSFGHYAADAILKTTADRLRSLEPGQFSTARFSGDEFVVVAEQLASVDDADAVIKHLMELFTAPFFVDEQELFITVSIGIALYPLSYGGKEQLIKDAESAMFHAKRQGGHRHEYYHLEIGKRLSNRLSIETSLRKALDNNEFEVYYQPQVAVPTQRIIGMEALVRWNHPERGLVSPDDFIPIAEETGLIVPLGSWVMETAAAQVAAWKDQGFGLLRVGINLSARQFQDKDLAKEVADVISKTGILPPSLDMEVTESSVMNDIEQTIRVLNQFKEMDIQTSMDDFGTGYSSLSYLQQMPLHTLKIDRAFIKDIQPDGTNGEIAKVIIAMCHALGLNVIAEGVETEEQMQFLSKYECNEAQGYLISRPLPTAEMESLLRASIIHDAGNKKKGSLF